MNRLSTKDRYRVQVVDTDYYRKLISCQDACPVHTDAQGYVNAVAGGNLEQGYIRARQPNPFASTCGRVCNAPCETACRRGAIDAPIAIRALKRFLCEQYGVEAMSHLPIARAAGMRAGTSLLYDPAPFNSATAESFNALRKTAAGRPGKRQKTAVLGSGPAGLTAAHDLAALGYQVTIFEAASVPGGMSRLGVPDFRLPRNVLDLEIADILAQGVELRLNTPVGPALTLKDLREQGYEAIFIAMGLYKSRELDIEGINLDGVLRAIDFLLNVNMGYKVDLGQKVLVIGGGAVAIDVARSATRLGVADPYLHEGSDLTTAVEVAREALRRGPREVHVLCLESREEMPAAAIAGEVEDALDEGVILHTRVGPHRILGRQGQVIGLETIAVKSVFDSQGRFNPTFIPGTQATLEGDTIVMAIGQTSDLSFITPADGIQITRRGTIAADATTLATTAPGIFAGGDVVFGPRIIIEAVRDGHTSALSIDEYMRGRRARAITKGWTREVSHPELPDSDYYETPYRRPPITALDRRVGIAEVEHNYSPEMAVAQAKRCLKCHIQTVFNGDLCILCGGCVDICPQNCYKMVRLDKLQGDERVQSLVEARYGLPWEAFQKGGEVLSQGTAMIKDEARCVRCGLCADRCPTRAITMEEFSFEEELVYEEKTHEEAGARP